MSSGFNCYDDVISGIDIVIDVTAVSGTLPTMDVVVQTAFETTVTNWETIRSIPRINATGKYSTTIRENIQKQIRISYTIDGTTPSFTFSANLVKHQ